MSAEGFNPDLYIANLSIDCVIFGFENGEMKVLLGKLPFGENLYNLPGGHIKKTESVDAAASRLLFERTQIKDLYLSQCGVFGGENRIVASEHKELIVRELSKKYVPEYVAWITERFVCVGYYALVEISSVKPVPGEKDEFFEWISIHELPQMVHDHQEILQAALLALRLNFDQKLIAFNLLPKTFTMKDLQKLYEAVYEKQFPMNNFQKRILDLNVLERLEKQFTGAQNKAPYLYQFSKKIPFTSEE
jgi:8-oxo-dGTP diphosphatase